MRRRDALCASNTLVNFAHTQLAHRHRKKHHSIRTTQRAERDSKKYCVSGVQQANLFVFACKLDCKYKIYMYIYVQHLHKTVVNKKSYAM